MIARVPPHGRDGRDVAELRERPSHLRVAGAYPVGRHLVEAGARSVELVADAGQVRDFQHRVEPETVLHPEVPLLRVPQPAVLLDELGREPHRLAHPHRPEAGPDLVARRVGEPVPQQEGGRDAVVRRRELAARLEAGAGSVRARQRRPEKGPVARPYHGVLPAERLPGEAEPRTEVVVVAVVDVVADAVASGKGHDARRSGHRVDRERVESVLPVRRVEARGVGLPAQS